MTFSLPLPSAKVPLVVNAANTDKDFAWMNETSCRVTLDNVSDAYAQLALQGPKAQEILQTLTDTDLDSLRFFWFNPAVKIAGIECLVSRTGYTGEDGFEIYVQPAEAVFIWEEILQAGGDLVAPIGLGARDSLRFEAKLPLYGQELTKDITPLEAGLGFFVKLDIDDDFIGKSALQKQKAAGLSRKLVEFAMLGKGIPRAHYAVQKEGITIGQVTSGLHSPTFKKPLGLALIQIEHTQPGTEIDIMIRDIGIKAVVGTGLFYRKKPNQNKIIQASSFIYYKKVFYGGIIDEGTENLLYSKDHEWIRVEGTKGLSGLAIMRSTTWGYRLY